MKGKEFSYSFTRVIFFKECSVIILSRKFIFTIDVNRLKNVTFMKNNKRLCNINLTDDFIFIFVDYKQGKLTNFIVLSPKRK